MLTDDDMPKSVCACVSVSVCLDYFLSFSVWSMSPWRNRSKATTFGVLVHDHLLNEPNVDVSCPSKTSRILWPWTSLARATIFGVQVHGISTRWNMNQHDHFCLFVSLSVHLTKTLRSFLSWTSFSRTIIFGAQVHGIPRRITTTGMATLVHPTVHQSFPTKPSWDFDHQWVYLGPQFLVWRFMRHRRGEKFTPRSPLSVHLSVHQLI